MTGSEAVLFAFVFILFGSFASIAAFIGGNLLLDRLRDSGVSVEVVREKDGRFLLPED